MLLTNILCLSRPETLMRFVLPVLRRINPDACPRTAASWEQLLELEKVSQGFQLLIAETILCRPDMKQVQAALCRGGWPPIIGVGESQDPQVVAMQLRSGFKGYLNESLPTELAASAVELVLAGGTYVPPCVVDAVNTPSPRLLGRSTPLTARQQQVLQLLSQGKSNKQIGRDLSLSEATVKAHVSAVFKALGASNRTQAVLATRDIQSAASDSRPANPIPTR